MSPKRRRGQQDSSQSPDIVAKHDVGSKSFWNLLGNIQANLSIQHVLWAGALLRLALLIYGHYQDQHPIIKFTDIDYMVFTDASRYIYQGQSPYLRDTYRYTPLLAFLTLGNVTWWAGCGKVIFCISDLMVGYLIYLMGQSNSVLSLSKDQHQIKRNAALTSALWTLNPFVAVISARGNAESIISLLVLGSLYFILARKFSLVGYVLFGLSVHFKIYPIIYALPIWLYCAPGRALFPSNSAYMARIANIICSFFSRQRFTFALVSGGTFLLITGLMYAVYGQEFLNETYLYHISRRDHRHNFSVYFYSMYLGSDTYSFAPQLLLVSILGGFYGARKELLLACFMQTFAFVHYNKVLTSQYFMWYIGFLPLVTPHLSRTGYPALVSVGSWVLAQALWLSQAYRLEHLGEPTFRELWICSAFFQCTSIGILIYFITYCHPSKIKSV